MSHKLDFRSDTVTRPTAGMLEAMIKAPLGDDVFGDDPTVIKLEEKVAELTGKEAALFLVTGTMANQVAVKSLLISRPDILLPEVLCDVTAHLYRWECAGLGYHSRAQAFPLTPLAGKYYLTAEQVEANLHFDRDLHRPITTVIALEVPSAGRIMPFEEIKKISAVAKKNNVLMHLDGARIWNACAVTGISLKQYSEFFDSVSLCFSKGLGAPIGSVIAGTKHNITNARQLRKQFGGGWRQAGILAAACIYALDYNWPRIHEDHDNCKLLAKGLKSIGFNIKDEPESNIIIVDSTPLGIKFEYIKEELGKKDILILGAGYTSRLVVHLQTPKAVIETILQVLSQVVNKYKSTHPPISKL